MARSTTMAAVALLLGVGLPQAGVAQDASAAPMLSAMQQELTRSMTNLKAQPVAPYFLSYQIVETHSVAVYGSYGTVIGDLDQRRRILHIDLRVGSPSFDNTHAMHGGGLFDGFAGGLLTAADMPLDDNVQATRRMLWFQTDQAYKQAVDRYTRAKANAQVTTAAEDSSPDFSSEAANQYRQPLTTPVFDQAAWARKVRAYTAPFAAAGDIYDGNATLSFEGDTRWYVNSDGSALQTAGGYYRLVISAYTKADDGMELPRYETFVALTPEGLPDDSTVLKVVKHMITDLHALKQAPVIDAYTGPAILSGRASGVFFHEVFGHRVEGHRQKDEGDAQTFTKKVGEEILPTDFSVYADPTQRQLNGIDLAGYYLYDDEGVKGQRVDVVTNGVLKSFLMSRDPIAGFAHSNGHGRSQAGYGAVARQSNLVVTSSHPVSRAALKQQLIDLIKQQQKPFGLFFDDIEGGFTLTRRSRPNAFDVLPIMVYRIYPDGREELVRGVDLIGTPLTVFSKVVAADDDMQVFNGVCGAESGWVPVSASSPGILVSQIEVQKKDKSQEPAPILPPPGATHS